MSKLKMTVIGMAWTKFASTASRMKNSNDCKDSLSISINSDTKSESSSGSDDSWTDCTDSEDEESFEQALAYHLFHNPATVARLKKAFINDEHKQRYLTKTTHLTLEMKAEHDYVIQKTYQDAKACTVIANGSDLEHFVDSLTDDDINYKHEAIYIAMTCAVLSVRSVNDDYGKVIRRVMTAFEEYDVNYLGKNARSVLHIACNTRPRKIYSTAGVQLIISDSRCNVNLRDANDETALAIAMSNVKSADDTYAQIVKMILQHPNLDINTQDEHGLSALHNACGTGIRGILSSHSARLLLDDSRIDVNLKNNAGQSAVTYPLLNVKLREDKFGEIILMLLEHQNFNINLQDEKGQSPLINACGGLELKAISTVGIEMLLNQRQCNVNLMDESGLTALMWAIVQVKSETDNYGRAIKALLKHPDIQVNQQNEEGVCALHVASGGLACGIESSIGAKLLLSDSRCDVNLSKISGETPLMMAIFEKESPSDAASQVIQMLLQHPDININQTVGDGKSALHTASGGMTPEVRSSAAAKLLLSDSRCDVNLADEDGNPALVYAVLRVCHNDHYEDIIRMFLQHPQLCINAQNIDGQTPLHAACGGSQMEVQSSRGAELLLSDSRCDTSVTDNSGITALTQAASKVQSTRDMFADIVHLFEGHTPKETYIDELRKGAEMFCFNCTELHLFRSDKNVTEVLQMLLPNPATDNSLFTPLMEAIYFKSLEICEYLFDKYNPDCLTHYSLSRADEDAEEETLVHAAVGTGSVKKLSLVFQQLVNRQTTWHGLTAFEYAISLNSKSDILLLLAANMKAEEINQALEKCGVANETADQCAERLGLKESILCYELPAIKRKKSELRQGNTCKAKVMTRICSKLLTIERSDIEKLEDVYNTLEMSRIYVQNEGNIEIVQAVTAVLLKLSQMASVHPNCVEFTPILAGSVAEGTKCFFPDEFDFICVLHKGVKYSQRENSLVCDVFTKDSHSESGVIQEKPHRISQLFYSQVEAHLQQLVSENATFGKLNLFKFSLVIKDKISKLQFQWSNDNEPGNLTVNVDLVPCFAFAPQDCEELSKNLPLGDKCKHFFLVNKDRRIPIKGPGLGFKISFSAAAEAILKTSPLKVREGYVLAKALRIADITRPKGDLSERYHLAEDVHPEELITSFMLKNCLIQLLASEDGLCEDDRSAVEWSMRIYKKLANSLKYKVLVSWFDEYEILFDCTSCNIERGCCYKRKFTLALTKQILSFLKSNQSALSSISFSHRSEQYIPPEVSCENVLRNFNSQFFLTKITSYPCRNATKSQ